MAKGGHARSGPAPDPNALRRDRDAKEWKDLPAGGRAGDPPEWPLADPTAAELELWAREWTRPQATEWETNGQALEVALFVRSVIVAESPKATAADRTLVQRKMTDLGLTVPGLRANRWRIAGESTGSSTQRSRPRRESARSRLQVVQGGKDAEKDGGAGS